MKQQPAHRVIVIGAARSGTKIMRDSLALATGAGVVPYDIGFVWRLGSDSVPHDRLDPGLLRQRQRRFITRYVDGYAAGSPPAVIEKTVGNTLRVPFVEAVAPGSHYVHLIRDGVDVTESTWRQWRAPADYRYLARKLQHFPPRLIPGYGSRYVRSLAHRNSRSERVATWGPRYPGIDDDLASNDLLTVCARQWRESVRTAQRDLKDIDGRSIEVRYEALVDDPETQLRRVAEFCGLVTSPQSLRAAASSIRPGRAGTGRAGLNTYQREEIATEIGSLLSALGYEPAIGSPPSDEEQSHHAR